MIGLKRSATILRPKICIYPLLILAGMLLNSVDNSQSLVDAYRCAINAMRSQLPLAQLVARREFLDYRIALLSNILPEAKDGPSSRPQSASPLEKERTILNHRLIQKLNDYERANKVPFLYRGVR